MSVRSRYYPNLYKDSVSLMTVSAKVTSVEGIRTASVVMASATNVDNLRQAGLGDFEVRPNDLVVACSIGGYGGSPSKFDPPDSTIGSTWLYFSTNCGRQ